jgi:hypothetical protein
MIRTTGVGWFYPELSRRAATYVDRILKGAKPAERGPTRQTLILLE